MKATFQGATEVTGQGGPRAQPQPLQHSPPLPGRAPAQPTPAWLSTSTVSQSWPTGTALTESTEPALPAAGQGGARGDGARGALGQQDGGVGLGCSRNRSPGTAATFQTGAPTNVGADWSLLEVGAPVCAGAEGAAQPQHGCLPRAQEPWSPLSPLLAVELLQNL